MLLLLLLLLQFTITSLACSPAPFAIPLRICTLNSGVQTWGNLVEIGTPPQRICLVPSTVLNSTLVSQRTLCAKSGTPAQNQCESLRGGFYNQNASSSWHLAPTTGYNDTRANPTWDQFNPPGITTAGFEIINFPIPSSDSITLYGSGVALNEYGNVSNAGMLGLGKDSVFLNDVVLQKKAPSKTWSLDSGSTSTHARDGELVVGGYNKGRIDGSLRWFPISNMTGERPCPLRTKITDIHITVPNGTSYPLKSPAYIIDACVEPYDNLFRFTDDMLRNWKAITNFQESLMDNVYGQQSAQNITFTEFGLPYSDQMVQEWTLSITLDDKYTSTVPHYEMQGPLMGWNAAGERVRIPNVTSVAILKDPTNNIQVPTLGKIFLSRSLLAVDYENNQFGLAEALIDPNPPQLVPLGRSTCNPRPVAHVGAIVGGVVGGVALILAILCLFLWARRRKRAERERLPSADVSSTAQARLFPAAVPPRSPQELPSPSTQEPHEVQGSTWRI